MISPAMNSSLWQRDGGELHIEWREQDNHIIMTGPVEDEGEIHLSTGTAR